MFFSVNLGAVTGKQGKNFLIMNRNAQLAENFPGFGDDFLDQIIA